MPPYLISEESGIIEELPESYKLYQNFPNPFNPATTISFDLPNDNLVKINIYNLLGQKVKSLLNLKLTAGTHEIIWDGKNEVGQSVSSGLYLLTIKTGEYSALKKMILLR